MILISQYLDQCAPAAVLTAELIGYFSIDSDLQYRADLSQLKYYIPLSDPDNVNFDLKVNCTSTRHKPTSYNKLDYILRWISDNFHQIERPLSVQEERWYVDKSLFKYKIRTTYH